jgi:methylenetetrahydrofolate reductase (NADPH)
MPIVKYSHLARFYDICGAEKPCGMRKTMEGTGDDVYSVQRFGRDVVKQLCVKLITGGAQGIHFHFESGNRFV